MNPARILQHPLPASGRRRYEWLLRNVGDFLFSYFRGLAAEADSENRCLSSHRAQVIRDSRPTVQAYGISLAPAPRGNWAALTPVPALEDSVENRYQPEVAPAIDTDHFTTVLDAAQLKL